MKGSYLCSAIIVVSAASMQAMEQKTSNQISNQKKPLPRTSSAPLLFQKNNSPSSLTRNNSSSSLTVTIQQQNSMTSLPVSNSNNNIGAATFPNTAPTVSLAQETEYLGSTIWFRRTVAGYLCTLGENLSRLTGSDDTEKLVLINMRSDFNAMKLALDMFKGGPVTPSSSLSNQSMIFQDFQEHE